MNHLKNQNNSSLTVLGDNVTVVALTYIGNLQIYLGRLDNSMIDKEKESYSYGYTLFCTRTKQY